MDSLILLLPLALLALLFFSSSRRRREAATVQRTLAPGTQIVTTAGLFATIVEVEDTAVVLETSPGVRSRWARAAVARVVPEPVADASADGSAGPAAGAGVDDAPGGAVPDDLAALDPDRADPPSGGPGRSTGSSGSTRADGPDLTKQDRRGGIDEPGGTRP